MCGRFALTAHPDALVRIIDLTRDPGQLFPRYNIAPTQPIAFVRVEDGARVLATGRWGLVPSWSKEPTTQTPLFNARAEGLFDKPSFRGPARHRRCVVPASGFYEWDRKTHAPFWFRPRDGELLLFAGLWDRWIPSDGSGEAIDSVTIVTLAADAFSSKWHDRMPARLDTAGVDRWLDPNLREPAILAEILHAGSAVSLEAVPVGPEVNQVRNEGERLIRPVTTASGEQIALFGNGFGTREPEH